MAPKSTLSLLFTYGLVAMLLLQTVTHIHCRAIRRGILTKISLRIEHAGGKYVMVTEDGSVEATGCKIDDSTSFYIREPIPDVFTFESVQNKTQFLLVNETGDLVVASPPELEGQEAHPPMLHTNGDSESRTLMGRGSWH